MSRKGVGLGKNLAIRISDKFYSYIAPKTYHSLVGKVGNPRGNKIYVKNTGKYGKNE
jgi:hypothetical protein